MKIPKYTQSSYYKNKIPNMPRYLVDIYRDEIIPRVTKTLMYTSFGVEATQNPNEFQYVLKTASHSDVPDVFKKFIIIEVTNYLEEELSNCKTVSDELLVENYINMFTDAVETDNVRVVKTLTKDEKAEFANSFQEKINNDIFDPTHSKVVFANEKEIVK